MNVLLLAATIALLVLIVGIVLMWLVVGASQVVTANSSQIEQESKVRQSLNPKATRGHNIPTQSTQAEKLIIAQKEAAKRAAQLPRGGNMGIGRSETVNLAEKKVASLGVDKDPVTATKIAEFHSWSGLEYSAPSTSGNAGSAKEKPSAKPAIAVGGNLPSKPELITISAGMSPDEQRKATIANAKAQSAYNKALKAAGGNVVAESAAEEQPTSVATTSNVVATAPLNTTELPSDLVKITEGMSPDEKRRAKIGNAKILSAFKKQLKEQGVDPASLDLSAYQ